MSIFLKEILYNGHLQSLGVAGLVYISGVYLSVETPFIVYLLVYSLFQLIYRFDAFYGMARDELTNHARVGYLGSHKSWAYSGFSLFFIIFVSILVVSNAGTILISLAVLTAGILYPVIFKDLSKYIPLFKDIYVSSVFAFFTIFPFIALDIPLKTSLDIKLLALFVFLESMIMQSLLDLKDLEGDSRDELKTLPVLLGFNRTVFVLTLASVVVLLFFGLTPLLVLAVPALVLNLLSIYLITSQRRFGYTVAAFKFIVLASLFLWAQFV
ncbi:MAG: UbiA family prenyltransferase [bacterium]|nr:UbiA family prenyltransferase [bacterium]